MHGTMKDTDKQHLTGRMNREEERPVQSCWEGSREYIVFT